MPQPLAMVDRGVVHFAGQAAHSGLLRGFEVTATDPADDQVHVAAGFCQLAGLPYGFIGSSHTLNQNDGSAAALASGESYFATLSVGTGGVTATKGDKAAADPDKPSVPAGERFLKYVEVTHEVGGTSVIETSDLSGETLYDRFEAREGTGLELIVHSGDAVGGGSWRFYRHSESLTLEDDDTNYIWQTAQGLWSVTQSATLSRCSSACLAALCVALDASHLSS